MNKSTSAAALALALGAALAVVTSAAQADDMSGKSMEKCYGVAMKGKNDCKAGAGTTCAGTAKTDYEGIHWKFVPEGSCLKTPSPTSPTGFGQLQAFNEQ